MTIATAGLYDRYGEKLQVLTPMFNDYGGLRSFCGVIATVKVHEDNSLVRSALEEPGEGRVLVIDGGGSLRCALVGDQLALLAQQNGWLGMVVYGCIRDSAAIATVSIGLKAMNTNPRKSVKKGFGERDIAVSFAGVTFTPGAYLYADSDGVLVANERLA
ncbi:MAG: ribonuclease E activity regulator RraA [Gammaproteobacteria bacterium]